MEVIVSDGALIEAYQRFHRTGPEWVDGYIRRPDELPRATGRRSC